MYSGNHSHVRDDNDVHEQQLAQVTIGPMTANPV